MALSKISPDPERVEKLAYRMKEIFETIWLRDPVLNSVEEVEFKRIKKEIEDMGLFVTWEVALDLDDLEHPKLHADVNVLTPKNTTLH
ncbi:MAG: hypothetical protein HY505_01200 [Candidatus Yanofskybacteria bacterium]|nr:hypothetical protein [Candidatus Yanofskybacteria bacterium]